MLGVSSVNQYLAPMLAEFSKSRTDVGLKRLLARASVLNVAVSAPLLFLVVVFGPQLLSLFGPAFVAAYPVIAILAVGNLLNLLWGALWGDLLTMTGLQNESAVIVIAVTALNVVLTLVLTPAWGVSGAATATTVAVLARSFAVAYVVRRHFGIYPWTVLPYIVR
jgi:O-antigen/teichoic acid export membrane protein